MRRGWDARGIRMDPEVGAQWRSRFRASAEPKPAGRQVQISTPPGRWCSDASSGRNGAGVSSTPSSTRPLSVRASLESGPRLW